MELQELHNLRRWFADFCKAFYTPDKADQKNIALKEEHTHNVCANMAEIARDLTLDENRVMLAEAVALFHDVGRFPQFQKYRTFRDDLSTNHAALGAKVLIENKVLKNVPRRERALIIRAVTLHNVLDVPSGLDTEALLFLQMVRDADKLDIWRVFTDYFTLREEDRPSAAMLGLPEKPGYSPDILESLRQKGMVRLSMLRTADDFKLLQLAWIYDLNFPRSLQLVAERGYIDKIAALLPPTDEIVQAVDGIRDYVEQGQGKR